MTDSASEARQLARDYVSIWNDREYDRIPETVSESFQLFEPAVPDGQVQGPEGLEGFLQYIVAAFPDFHVEHLETLASEDRVMIETKYTLTHEGEFEEIPPTGRTVEIRGMEKLSVDDGEVTEHRLYYDLRDFFEQLGVEKP